MKQITAKNRIKLYEYHIALHYSSLLSYAQEIAA